MGGGILSEEHVLARLDDNTSACSVCRESSQTTVLCHSTFRLVGVERDEASRCAGF